MTFVILLNSDETFICPGSFKKCNLFRTFFCYILPSPFIKGKVIGFRMDPQIIRQYCLQKPEVTESFPFDESTLVFKVRGKMFALLNLEPPFSLNLKCDPEKAVEFRERYKFVLPGYHMNKKHWNTIRLDDCLSPRDLWEWIDESYALVIRRHPKKTQRKKAESQRIRKTR